MLRPTAHCQQKSLYINFENNNIAKEHAKTCTPCIYAPTQGQNYTVLSRTANLTPTCIPGAALYKEVGLHRMVLSLVKVIKLNTNWLKFIIDYITNTHLLTSCTSHTCMHITEALGE
jgi:hypothetical protein